MNIMITGATGGYGRQAVQFVKQFAPNANIFAMVRNADKAQALKQAGVEIRVADYSDVESMVRAFDGIDRLLFVSVPQFELQQNVVKAITQSTISYVVYTSLYGLEYQKFGLQINHSQTEALIKQTGIRHAFLRNTWYVDMNQAFVNMAKQTGSVFYYSGDNKMSGVLKSELAEAGARVIASGEFDGVINLTSQPYTYGEFAQAIAQAMDKPIEILSLSKDEFTKRLATVDLSQRDAMLASVYQDYVVSGHNGEELSDSTELEAILGRKSATLVDAAKVMLAKETYSG